MENRQKNLGTALILAGLLMLTTALLLFGRNVAEDIRAGRVSATVLSELEEAIPEPEPETESDAVPLYVIEPDVEMPTMEIDGNLYIGVLEIPALELSLPVMSEWSYPSLKIAPCRYSGSAYRDDLVIAAHNYDSHFGRLKKLEAGAEVIFTDADGNVFRYSVAETEVLQPTAIEEMKSGDWALTLFTCTVGGEYRVSVRCDKEGGKRP